MKKFFSNMSLQDMPDLRDYAYQPVGNSRLKLDMKTGFPILTAVAGYVEPGEEFAVYVVVPDSDKCRANFAKFQRQLKEVCQLKGLKQVEAQAIAVETGSAVSNYVSVFQKLIDKVEDDDELYACVTYGTKPMSQALMMAVQYAYRVKRNASIGCIVYGEIDRDVQPNQGYVYDETALVQLDEIVRLLADRGVKNPKETIDRILAL